MTTIEQNKRVEVKEAGKLSDLKSPSVDEFIGASEDQSPKRFTLDLSRLDPKLKCVTSSTKPFLNSSDPRYAGLIDSLDARLNQISQAKNGNVPDDGSLRIQLMNGGRGVSYSTEPQEVQEQDLRPNFGSVSGATVLRLAGGRVVGGKVTNFSLN